MVVFPEKTTEHLSLVDLMFIQPMHLKLQKSNNLRSLTFGNSTIHIITDNVHNF